MNTTSAFRSERRLHNMAKRGVMMPLLSLLPTVHTGTSTRIISSHWCDNSDLVDKKASIKGDKPDEIWSL